MLLHRFDLLVLVSYLVFKYNQSRWVGLALQGPLPQSHQDLMPQIYLQRNIHRRTKEQMVQTH